MRSFVCLDVSYFTFRDGMSFFFNPRCLDRNGSSFKCLDVGYHALRCELAVGWFLLGYHKDVGRRWVTGGLLNQVVCLLGYHALVL